MRYEAPRVGRVLLTSMVLHNASPRPEGSMAERSKSLTARRRPPSYPRRTPRCAVEGRARRNLDQPITELSAARIAGARNVAFVRSGQSELAAGPEGKFSWLQGLEKSRNGKRISHFEVAVGPTLRASPPRSPEGPSSPPAEACEPLPGLDDESIADKARAVAHLFLAPARVKAACYFFCDFT
jgi:hypothetical protein